MTYDERASSISNLLWDHAHPALRRMDHQQIAKLTEQILQIATKRGLWTKWSQDREELASRVTGLSVPLEDLREALNCLPGPLLTKVDVEQRIRDLREKPYANSPSG